MTRLNLHSPVQTIPILLKSHGNVSPVNGYKGFGRVQVQISLNGREEEWRELRRRRMAVWEPASKCSAEAALSGVC